MATYAQLQDEPWWGAEFQPPTIAALCQQLRSHYGVNVIAIGSKGDNNHLRGYHRSRNWIRNSVYCTSRTYSVSRTAGDRSGGNGDWLCAIDMTIPRSDLLAACQRLDTAVRAGRLEKITEWYGNDDGDNRVDGYDNIANVVASSDFSHLFHLHMSFDRGRAGEDHSDLFAILTGVGDMDVNQSAKLDGIFNASKTVKLDTNGDGKVDQDFPVPLTQRLDAIDAKLANPTPVEVDAEAVAAALIANPDFRAFLIEAARQGAEQAEDS